MTAQLHVMGIEVEELDVTEQIVDELPPLEQWVENDELRDLLYKAYNGDIRVAYREAKLLMRSGNAPEWAKQLVAEENHLPFGPTIKDDEYPEHGLSYPYFG